MRTGAASKANALLALSALATEVRTFAVPAPEPDADLDAVTKQARALLERGVNVLSELQDLEPEEPITDDALDDMFADTSTEGALETRVGDLCFAGLIELRTALRGLTNATTPADRIVAVELAGRRLRSALRAVLALASVGGARPSELPANEELESALAARRAYAAFRRGLRRAESNAAEAVLRAIQYAAGALASLAASPEYPKLFESDRATLRGLKERALAWARGGRDIGEGLALLEDIHTSADLLGKINDRPELRIHDRAIFSKIEASSDERERIELLASLRGRDEELDLLAAQLASGGEATEIVWALVILRFGALR